MKPALARPSFQSRLDCIVRVSSHSPLQRSGFPLAPAVRRACHSELLQDRHYSAHRYPPLGGYGADGEQTATPTDRSPGRDMGVVRKEYIARFPTLVFDDRSHVCFWAHLHHVPRRTPQVTATASDGWAAIEKGQAAIREHRP